MEEAQDQGLKSKIVVNPPFGLVEAPEAYTFVRDRVVPQNEMAWDEVFDDKPDDDGPGYDAEFLRGYFFEKWGVADDVTNDYLVDQLHVKRVYLWTLEDLSGDPDITKPAYVVGCLPKLENVTFGIDVRDDKYATRTPVQLPRVTDGELNFVPLQYPNASEANPGIVFHIDFGSRGERFYRPYVSVNEATGVTRYLQLNDFLANGFEAVHGIEMIYGKVVPDEATKLSLLVEGAIQSAQEGFSVVDTYRADAALIARQWGYVAAEAAIAKRMADSAGKLIGDDASVPTTAEGWRALSEQYHALMEPSQNQKVIENQIADAAADLGYRMFLDKATITVKREGVDPLRFTVERGELYLEQIRTTSWTTWHTVKKKRRRLFSSKSKTYQVPRHHSKTYTFFHKVTSPSPQNASLEVIDYDPWVEGAKAYEEAGFNVFLMTERPGGYLESKDGSTLSEVMNACDSDESFRRKCVVAVPVYENTIVGRQLLAGYTFFVRPCRGLSINDDPELALNEDLSYRFAWFGNRMGEMAASIPLAPGEEQEITISRSEETESSTTSTATTLTELSTVNRRDFESTFEREVTKESSRGVAASTSASVPTPYGTYGGSLSGKRSTRSVARTLNRAVKRTSQEISRKSRTETKVTVSQKVSLTTTNSVTHKIKNINSGATLNLNLYRLLNHYQAGLFLDDFKIMVSAGPALIEGTEIRDVKTFMRSELDDLLNHLRYTAPVDLSDDEDFIRFSCRFLRQLLQVIRNEYDSDTGDGDGDEECKEDDPGFGVLRWNHVYEGDVDCSGELEEVRKVIDELRKQIGESEVSQKCPLVKRADFAFDSGALYIDAIMGQGDGTEEFAKDMRNLEKDHQRAETELIRAEASSLSDESGTDMDQNPDYITEHDLRTVRNKLSFEVKPPARDSEPWFLYVDGSLVEHKDRSGGAGKVTFEYEANQLDWLRSWGPRDFHARVFLKHEETGERIGYRFRD